jgi:hypothetical protein
MKAISEFFSRLIPYVPGCSEPLAQQALLDSAIAFCEASQVIRHDLDVFNTVVGRASYELDLPSQQQLARILLVKVGDQEIYAELAESRGYPPEADAIPTAFFTTRNDSDLACQLYPVPDKVYPVRVRVALRPTKAATQLENDLVDYWTDPIVDGAMARILAIPDQPFSDLNKAMMMRASAARGIHNARIEGNYGRVRGSMRVKQRPIA